MPVTIPGSRALSLIGLGTPVPLDLTDGEVTDLLLAPPHEGLTCLLGGACDAGLVRCSAAARADVEHAWAERLTAVVELDRLLLAVVTALSSAGLAPVALKGAATATLDEIDPAWRSYGDVDVLVGGHELVRAADVLRPLGLVPIVEPVRRWWSDRYAKSLTLVDPDGRQVDLHRRLLAGPLGERLDHDAIRLDGDTIDVGGTAVPAMSRRHRFAHACLHAAVSPVRSHRHRRDVLLLAARCDPADVPLLASVGWSTTAISAALRWADEGSVLPDAWRHWAEGHADDPDDIALVRAAQGSEAAMTRLALRRSAPWRSLPRAAGLLVPSRAHLRSRGVSRWSHLGGVARSAVGREGP